MSATRSIKGLVALVTGSASGLGRATAERFVAQGAKVVICDLPASKGQEVADELGSDSALYVPADVTSEADVLNALSATKQKFGRLDINVNCAGVGLALKTYSFYRDTPHSLEEFVRVLNINAVGTFNVIRLAVGLMGKNRGNADGERGVIVNTASMAAYDGRIGQAAYCAGKGAVVGMTLPIARDLASQGIRCCTIAPGVFETPMVVGRMTERNLSVLIQSTPFPKRLGFPDEFAHLVQTIVENSMLNGEIIRLDGALRMPP